MKNLLLVLLLAVAANAFGQSAQPHTVTHLQNEDEGWQFYDNINGIDGPCNLARDIYKQAEARIAQYNADVDDYKKGLFCSDCKRSAHQIEREDKISFQAHIDQGANHGRHEMAATQSMYDDLYMKFQADFEPLKKQHEQKVYECTNGIIKLQKDKTSATDNFNTKYSQTFNKLSKLNESPAQNNTNYYTQLNQLKTQFQDELNKGNDTDPAKLNQITSSVDDLNNQVINTINSNIIVASNSPTINNSGANNLNYKITTPVSSNNTNSTLRTKQAQMQQFNQNLTNQMGRGNTQTPAQTTSELAGALTNLVGAISNNNNNNNNNQTRNTTVSPSENNNYSPPVMNYPLVNNGPTNNSSSTNSNNSLVNSKAPAIQFTQTNGAVFRLSDYAGKKILLVFWASYNDVSIEQFNIIKSNYSLLSAKHITIIGMAQEYSSYQWQTTVKDNQLPGLQLSELNGTGNDTYDNYKVTGLPTLFYINALGEIIAESNNFNEIKSIMQ